MRQWTKTTGVLSPGGRGHTFPVFLNVHGKLGVALLIAEHDEPHVLDNVTQVSRYPMRFQKQTNLVAQASTAPIASSRLDVLANTSRGEDVEQDAIPEIQTVLGAAVPMPVVEPEQPGEVDEVGHEGVLPRAFEQRQFQLLLQVTVDKLTLISCLFAGRDKCSHLW